MTPRRKVLAIVVVVLIALYGFIIWGNHRDGGISYVPVRVQSSAKSMISSPSCQPIDSGSYLVIGYVEATLNSGVIKIGVKVHYTNVGSSKASFSFPGTTYVDTTDQNFRPFGSGSQEFAVIVDTDGSTDAPTYCSISAGYVR